MLRALALLALSSSAFAQTRGAYDVFDFVTPKGWTTEKTDQFIAFKKDDGTHYANVFLFKPRKSAGSVKADFEADWKLHAQKHGLPKPEATDSANEGPWQALIGTGTAPGKGSPFIVVVATVSGRGVSYAQVTYTNDDGASGDLDALNDSIAVNEDRFAKPAAAPAVPDVAPQAPSSQGLVTQFDDGWKATAGADFVQLTNGALEARLHYPNAALDDAKPNTTDVPEYYWAKLVQPAFETGAGQKWVGVKYPPVYFMEGPATDKRTGARCYLGMKVVFDGGARVVLVIAPTQAAFAQRFTDPNQLDALLGYNRFSVTTKDLIGTWVRGGGGMAEYVNVYTGNSAGVKALSVTDEYVFASNGTYSNTYRSANSANGTTQFGAVDDKGTFTVGNWRLAVNSKARKPSHTFEAHFEAVKNGSLLVLFEPENRQRFVYARAK